MGSSFSKDYSDDDTGDSLFGFGGGDGKGGVGPRTTKHTSKKLIDESIVVILCHLRLSNIHTWVIHTNICPILY